MSENQKAGQQASAAARKRVLEAHPDEFERYLVEEREARDLEPRVETLAQKVARLEAELATFRAAEERSSPDHPA